MHRPGAEFKGDAALHPVFAGGQAKAVAIGAAEMHRAGKAAGIGDLGQAQFGLGNKATRAIQPDVTII